jgi:hypothetical protein
MPTLEELIQKADSPEELEKVTQLLRNTIQYQHEQNPTELIMSELQPKQKLLLNEVDSRGSKWVGWGGSRGSAKSGGLRRIMLLRRLKYAGSVGVLFRKTFNDLRDNHITPLWQEYPFLRQYYNVQNRELTLPNGSRILFVYEENEKDFIETFQGKNYDDIFVDEATHLKEYQLVYMSTSCRTVRMDMKSKFVLSMNPGGTSHSFIKRIFIDKKYLDNEKKEDYTFIQAYGWDNVMWSLNALKEDGFTKEDYYSWDNNQRFDYFVNKTDYGSDLNKLPSNDRMAHLFGDWYVFAGQFFYMFSDANIIHKRVPVFQEFPTQGAIDYGKRTVFEVAQMDYEGRIIFVDEVYTDSGTPTERAEKIADKLIERELWNLKIACDTNMGITLTEYVPGADKSPIELFKEIFERRFREANLVGKEPYLYLVSKRAVGQYSYRVMCNEVFKDYLHRGLLKFAEDCQMAISTIPELVYDEKDKNGLDFDDKVGIDDPFDACKYCFNELYRPYMREAEKKPKTYDEWMERYIFGDIQRTFEKKKSPIWVQR